MTTPTRKKTDLSAFKPGHSDQLGGATEKEARKATATPPQDEQKKRGPSPKEEKEKARNLTTIRWTDRELAWLKERAGRVPLSRFVRDLVLESGGFGKR